MASTIVAGLDRHVFIKMDDFGAIAVNQMFEGFYASKQTPLRIKRYIDLLKLHSWPSGSDSFSNS